MPDYLERIQKPHPDSINSGLTSAKQSTMLSVLGRPRETLTNDCADVTNPKLKKLLETRDVGPFRVTAIKPFLDVLTRVFARVKENDPQLYNLLGSAGGLCCRRVRKTSGPPSKNFSNHSWGTAVDIKIGGILDKQGDNMCLRGLLALYGYFHAEKCYWGAEFPTEDSMHFEASDELIRGWKDAGIV